MNRRILTLAIPSIVANITTPLLSLVDTAIVGHLGSAVYIGAIAVGGVMFNMLYWLFSFLRGGTSGLTAQAFGAGDSADTSAVLWRSLAVGTLIGTAMVLLQWPLELILRHFVDPDPVTASLAGRYFRILIYGAPAVLATYALNGWFLGMQNSRMLMITSLVVNITNIAASLVLVFGMHMRIEGVALGSLIAQWAGFITGLALLRRFHVARPDATCLRARGLGRFFRVNVDMMLRTLCLILVTLWFTKAGARQGAVILAVNALLMQLFLLFSYVMDGFAFAGEALAGNFAGARDFGAMRQCVRQILVWGLILATAFTALYFFGGEWFLGILTADGDVIAASADYRLWAVTVPLAGFAAFAWDGIYIGATLTRQLLLSMAGATALFFILYFTLSPMMGNHGLWMAFIAYLAARGILQTILYKTHKWN